MVGAIVQSIKKPNKAYEAKSKSEESSAATTYPHFNPHPVHDAQPKPSWSANVRQWRRFV